MAGAARRRFLPQTGAFRDDFGVVIIVGLEAVFRLERVSQKPPILVLVCGRYRPIVGYD
ncbi:hypothetical protein [Haladaptatus sp. DYF46]|uniref:hypothetical protein n=1 Tax=Haladaptatus sp. DYF46 TaxID=2886041 RepID=UPI001E648398|nr:hypothetical protein [Haladaptatus sp. DYF46]